MINRKLLHVLSAFFVTYSAFIPSTPGQSLNYNISTLWNGTLIDHPDEPAKVTLTNVDGGELQIEVSAPYFSSPSISEPLLGGTCPQRSFYGLWNYEVVEVFLLNDRDDYIEIEFSPRGRYILLLLSGYRNTLLHSLPIFPDGVVVTNNCPLPKETPFADCVERWTATAVLPRQYLPFNVSRFNAYAIHGSTWGEVTPDADEIVYESLFPADPNVVAAPDFHYLDGFGQLSLASIGIVTDEVESTLWKTATGDENYSWSYDFARLSDCSSVPDDYEGHVVSEKTSSLETLALQVHISDRGNVIPSIPEDLQSADSTGILTIETESFWVTYSNEANEMLRVGVNPYEAHRIELWDNGTLLLDNLTLSDITCTVSSQASTWTCHFSLDWALLPPDVFFFQMVHAHMSLLNADDMEPAPEREFFGAVCAGIPQGVQEIDWKGCQIDLKTIIASGANVGYSSVWREALGMEPENPTALPGSQTKAALNSILLVFMTVLYFCI